MIQPPKVDERTASDLAKDVRGLLPKYVRGWPEEPSRGAAEALIRIFARYGELVIERLNKAPEKNFLAFLDLLGVSALPPQPARVPLTFYLASGAEGAVLPAGTQVAAQPAKGEQQPVTFETERELVITSAKLESLLVKDSTQDRFADYRSILDQPPPPVGQIAVSFTINGPTRTRPQKVVLAATAGEVLPIPGSTPSKVSVSGLSLSATTVRAGEELTCAVSLAAPAPVGGVPVFLQISESSCQLPSTVMVVAGQDFVTFTIQTSYLAGVPAFRGSARIPQLLYIGLRLPASRVALKQLRLSFALDQDAGRLLASPSLQWEMVVGRASPSAVGGADRSLSALHEDETFRTLPVNAASDGTENLTKSGDVVFADLLPFPEVAVGGVTSRWLRCRLLTPIVHGSEPKPGMLCEDELPCLKNVTVHTQIEHAGLGVDQAFINNLPLDLTKDFFPFGEKPKFGDTLYLSSREAFSTANAVVTLHFTLTNPVSGAAGIPFPPVSPQGTRLAWEFWDGEAWSELGTSEFARQVRILKELTEFSDSTKTFSESGDVSFRFPRTPKLTTVTGQANFWIRVRIISGDYGKEAHYEKDSGTGYTFAPATFAPPCVKSTNLGYVFESEAPADALLTYNDFRYARVPQDGTAFRPFQPVAELQPSLYLGFTPPASQTFANRSMSLYFGVSNSAQAQRAAPSTAEPATVVWEYWNRPKQIWMKWTVRDDTGGFKRSGLIRFLAPPDFSAHWEFGRECYWLRARRLDQTTDFEPRLSCVLLNTTMAAQTITTTHEVLGSSNGKPGQRFRLTRSPVLEGQQLDVLEPTMPSPQEQMSIKGQEGESGISRSINPINHREEIWVHWQEVPNFYASEPRDRHYLLNRLTGEVTFGDGANGLVPPALPGNIRMTRYQTGGGVAGNKPPLSISQLKTTVPYVEKVKNFLAATGGAEPETPAQLLRRAPPGIRHGGRAVTVQDFEDLAVLASPGVARARRRPPRDLALDPGSGRLQPGVVSLIIVPLSTDPKPLPSVELFERVRSFLDGHRILTADLILVGPDYVQVQVETEVAVEDPDAASDVELAVTLALRRFLHPLTGQLKGSGWDFGRRPTESDLYRLIEGVPGVSHVRALRITEIPDRVGAEKTGQFLIYSSDQHKVTVTLEE